MDERRKRDKDDPEPLLTDEEDQTQDDRGHETLLQGEETPRRTTSLVIKRPQLGHSPAPRRARLDPDKKRLTYIDRLERLWDQLDIIISDKETDKRTRINAMNTLIRCLRNAYGMVEAIEIEQIEEDIRKIEEEQSKHGYLGYRLPDEN